MGGKRRREERRIGKRGKGTKSEGEREWEGGEEMEARKGKKEEKRK